MPTTDENKVESKAVAPQPEEKRAMKIRLKTGVMAGPVVAVHL